MEENRQNIVIGLGEVLIDEKGESRTMGGAPANFCVHASQLGCKAILVSAVGEDDDADFIKAKLKEFGVEPCFTTGFLSTGLAVAKPDENGKMTYDIVYPRAWDRMGIPSCLTDLYVGVGAICFGTLAGRDPGNGALITALVKLAGKEGVGLRVFDVNLRPPYYSEEYIKGLMPLCSVLKLSDEEYPEIRKIYDLDADALKGCNQLLEKFNLLYVIYTCGADGSYVFSKDKMSYLKPPAVIVADTIGAGDSFTATFVASILDGCIMEEAHRRASEISAYVCSQPGGTPDITGKFKEILK